MGQIDAKHPNTMFDEFRRAILNEIARCINMPLNIALGNSENYNYASGRLDHQTYFKSIRVEQDDLSIEAIKPIARRWYAEARLISGYLSEATEEEAPGNVLRFPGSVPAQILPAMLPPCQVFYDGNEHVDPLKEANAQATKLKSLTTTHAAEYAKEGKDWRKEYRQLSIEKKEREKLGLTEEEAAPGGAGGNREPADEDEEEEDGEEDAA